MSLLTKQNATVSLPSRQDSSSFAISYDFLLPNLPFLFLLIFFLDSLYGIHISTLDLIPIVMPFTPYSLFSFVLCLVFCSFCWAGIVLR